MNSCVKKDKGRKSGTDVASASPQVSRVAASPFHNPLLTLLYILKALSLKKSTFSLLEKLILELWQPSLGE